MATIAWWLASLSSQNEVDPLYAAFSAFSECYTQEHDESSTERELLTRRLGAFTSRAKQLAEEEAKALPLMQLALMETLLPPGVSVILSDLDEEHGLNGCKAVLISCLSDGSFLCAIETHCKRNVEAAKGLRKHEYGQTQDPLQGRVHVSKLRPAQGCFLTEKNTACDGDEEAPPLDKALIAKAIADTVALKDGYVPEEISQTYPGMTGFPDLSYAQLSIVLVRLERLGCDALAADDLDGAEEALTHALSLEHRSRPKTLDRQEVSFNVRFLIARVHAARALVRYTRGKAAGARRDALAAQRVNVTASVSDAKLALAMANWLQLRVGAKGNRKSIAPEEVERLRTWFLKELIPLEEPPQKQELSSAAEAEARRHRLERKQKAEL